MSSERLSRADPWRLRCPEGHASVKRLNAPVVRPHGQKQILHVETFSGTPYQGRFYCQTCNDHYDEVLDAKTGNTISGRTPA